MPIKISQYYYRLIRIPINMWDILLISTSSLKYIVQRYPAPLQNTSTCSSSRSFESRRTHKLHTWSACSRSTSSRIKDGEVPIYNGNNYILKNATSGEGNSVGMVSSIVNVSSLSRRILFR